MISELRRYRIRPDRIESWLRFFEEVVEEHERLAIRVEYAGFDRETSTFVWLRSFEDEADRVARKDVFYSSEWWLEREAVAMSHVLEYDVTFLDAVALRDGAATAVTMLTDEERPGANVDAPPDGWTASTRRTFVPLGAERDGRSGGSAGAIVGP